MTPLVLSIAIVAVVTLGIWLLKVPAALVFFSLLVGQLLAQEVAGDVQSAVSNQPVNAVSWVEPFLIVLPVALTLFFLRFTVPKSKMVLELIPATLAGLTAALLLVPKIPAANNLVINSPFWQQAVTYKSIIFFTASIVALASSWFTFSKKHK